MKEPRYSGRLTGISENGTPITSAVLSIECPKCGKDTVVLEDNFWGKIFRCEWCTAIIADKRDTPPPAAEN